MLAYKVGQKYLNEKNLFRSEAPTLNSIHHNAVSRCLPLDGKWHLKLKTNNGTLQTHVKENERINSEVA